MKGLLIKDFKLAFANIRSLYFVAAILILVLTCGDDGIDFIVSFVVALSMMMVITTISYDDYDNGLVFLLSLPVSRRLYVSEKYVFAALSSLSVLTVSTLAVVIYDLVTGRTFILDQFLVNSVTACEAVSCLMLVMIPVRLKFGENGRIFIVFLLTLCFGFGFAASKVIGMDAVVRPLRYLDSMSPAGIVLSLGAVVALMTAVSWFASMKVMERKAL